MPDFYHPQEQTLAGQPQENSWPQQGNGYSQGAPGYGGPAYDQQGQPAPYPQQGQAYEQPGAYEQQGAYQQTQVYEQQAYQPPQPYEQQQSPAYDQPTVYEQQAYDQAGQQAQTQYGQQTQYDAAGQQAYAQPQHYPGQPQARQAQAQSQGWDQWQLPQQQTRPRKPAKPARTEHGFVGSLFDFGFTSFVTPKIIKVLYVLVTIWTILWALAFLRLGFHYGGTAGGIATLIVVDPILILVSLGVFRVVLEFFMVTFRMQEDLKALRDRGAGTTAQVVADGNADGDDNPSRVSA